MYHCFHCFIIDHFTLCWSCMVKTWGDDRAVSDLGRCRITLPEALQWSNGLKISSTEKKMSTLPERRDVEPCAVSIARIAISRSLDVSGEKLKVALLFWNLEASYPPSVKLAIPVLLPTHNLDTLVNSCPRSRLRKKADHGKEFPPGLTLRPITRPGGVSPEETWNTTIRLQILYQGRYRIVEGC